MRRLNKNFVGWCLRVAIPANNQFLFCAGKKSRCVCQRMQLDVVHIPRLHASIGNEEKRTGKIVQLDVVATVT